MRTGVGHGAAAQIIDQIFQFRAVEQVVGFHGVAADGLGHRVFAEARQVHFTPGGAQFIHQIKHKAARIRHFDKGRQGIQQEGALAKLTQTDAEAGECGQLLAQKLLLPETIELPPRDAQFLREQLAALTRLGVGLSEFGERTFLLDALPPFVKVPDSRRFVFDLVDELRAAGREVNLARLGEHTVAKTVCRHAVKANDLLNGPELENLIDDLRRCAMPYTCPHGRPTLIEMNYRELEKKFGRTQ